MTDDRRPEYLARLIRNGYVEGQVRGLREQGHTFKEIAAMLNLSLDHVKQFNAEDTGRQISRRRSRTEQLEAENAALQAEVERLRARGADYREIVEIVAANKGSVYGLGCHCLMDHREGCPVLVARALLASES